MKVAVNLFADKYLVKITTSFNVAKGKCDFTLQNNVDVLDLADSQIIADNLATIINLYSLTNDSNKNDKPLYKCLIKDWRLFSPQFDEDSILNFLVALFKNNEGIIDLDSLTQFAYISDNEGDGKKNYLLVANNDWNAFSNEIKYVNRFHTNLLNLKQFDKLLFALIEPIDAHIFYRGRISSKNGYSKEEMNTPPSEYAKSSRVSPSYISTLYLCNDINCVPNECRAVCNDYITIASFELNGDFNCFDLRKIEDLSPFDFPGEELFVYYNKDILAQLSEEIEKPMTSIDKECDYIPVQYLCEYMKHYSTNNSEYSIIGIVYKSVMTSDKSVFNLAAFSENHFSHSACKVYRVKEYRPVLIDLKNIE